MLRGRDYTVFGWTAHFGSVSMLEWLWSRAHEIGGNEEQRNMFMATEYSAFQSASANRESSVEVLNWFWSHASNNAERQAMLRSNGSNVIKESCRHGRNSITVNGKISYSC